MNLQLRAFLHDDAAPDVRDDDDDDKKTHITIHP